MFKDVLSGDVHNGKEENIKAKIDLVNIDNIYMINTVQEFRG